MTICLFIIVVLAIIIIWHFYYLRGRLRLSTGLAFSFLKMDLASIYRRLNKELEIWYLKQTRFCLDYDIQPYLDAVKGLNICKYFRFYGAVCINENILEFRFRILGISSAYRDSIKSLSILLEQLLQDFYKDRFGNLCYPLVHATAIHEGQVCFWIGQNAYGNRLIQERIYADQQCAEPNTGEIEDD